MCGCDCHSRGARSCTNCRCWERQTGLQLPVGSRIKLRDDGGSNRWWTVQAATGRYAALTRTRPFQPAGRPGAKFYTVIDRERGVRGPCNLIGQSYGDGRYTCEECEEMLAEFEAGELEVSYRNNVVAEITATQGVDQALVDELNREYDETRWRLQAEARQRRDEMLRQREEAADG